MSVAQKRLELVDTETFEEHPSALDYQLNNTQYSKKIPLRTLLIFSILALSIFIFILDKFLILGKVNPEDTSAVPPVDIKALLISVVNPISSTNKISQEKPLTVANLIANQYTDTETLLAKEVVIYEIIDLEENKRLADTHLKEAELLLRQDKLTAPLGNNAFERYEAVLAVDPENRKALLGIRKIFDRYVFFIDKVIDKKEEYKIPALLKNAKKVGEKYFDVYPILSQYKKYLKEESVFIELDEKLASSPVEKSKQISDAIVKKESIVDVDIKTAIAAKRLLDSGNKLGAITILKNFSLYSNYWGHSYDLFLSLLLSNQDFEKAELLVNSNETLSLFQFAEKVARIFVARGDVEGGLMLLKSHSPKIEQYQKYYALKAALYYHSNNYRQAVDLYKRLLNIDFDNAYYWLGLAVSLDGLGSDDTLEAFRYADNYSQQGSVVKNYIQQRILILSE